MATTIRVMVVDDLQETRESIYKFLQFDPGIEVIGEAASGREAIEKARQLQPDVILMDVNMPDMDGISATKAITQSVPMSQIIIMSVQSDTPYMRQAMMAGARDFLMKPFSLDDLLRAIHEVYERRPATPVAPYPAAAQPHAGIPATTAPAATLPQTGKIWCVFSPKGGSGCTTLALNLAVSLAEKGYRTLLFDGSLQFGTISVMLNLKATATVLELVERMDELDADLITSVVLTHDSGLQVLLAPRRPEMAELVTTEHIQKLLPALRNVYQIIILDTSSCLNEMTLTMLDQADRILLVTEQNLPNLKTARDFLNLSQDLHYAEDKVVLTVNRMLPKNRVTVKDIAKILKRPVVLTIPLDNEAATRAADRGHPIVSGGTRKRPVAQALRAAAAQLVADPRQEDGDGALAPPPRQSFFARLFGR
ncbi:MAG: response regulator [Ardenticatenales bacterium]|nr:response regulator [Ardenticatenales bacterium]